MEVLRDLRKSTELLILFELVKDPKVRMKSLAEKLGMTVQGVSEYLKHMTVEGLLHDSPGEHKPTRMGVQQLHDGVTNLRDFVVEAVNRLEIIRTCPAVAGNNIKAGDKLGLFMENGVLVAYSGRKSSSSGTALETTGAGRTLEVCNLEGVVDLKPGNVRLIALADEKTTMGQMKKIRETKYDRLGVLDLPSLIALRNANIRRDFEFAAVASAVEAAQRGLDVLLVGRTEECRRAATLIGEQNARVHYAAKIKLKNS